MKNFNNKIVTMTNSKRFRKFNTALLRISLGLSVMLSICLTSCKNEEQKVVPDEEVAVEENNLDKIQNPVLPGDFADPSVVRVGDDYWATATSSEGHLCFLCSTLKIYKIGIW